MKALANVVDDRINPVVVKEVRQAVRSRFVLGMFLFFLVAELVVVGLYLAIEGQNLSTQMQAGATLASILVTILSLACVLLVPLYSGIRLAAERAGLQMDLMFTTSLSPYAIIRGKMVNAAVLAVLLYSACAPFISLTFLLRGVDLTVLFLQLGMLFLTIILLAQMGVFLATVPMSPILKGVAGGLLLIGVLFSTAGTMVNWRMMVGFMTTSDMLLMLGTQGSITLAVAGFLYFGSSAMISPPSANRMMPLRIYMVSLWAVSLGAILLCETFTPSGWAGGFMLGWAISWSILLGFWFVVAVSQRRSWGPRMQRSIRRWPTLPAFLLFSGSGGSVVTTSLLGVLTFGAFALFAMSSSGPSYHGDLDEIMMFLAGCLLYGLAYALTAARIRDGLGMLGLYIRPVYNWLTAILLWLFGIFGPLVIAAFFAIATGGRFDGDEGPWLWLSPAGLVANAHRSDLLGAQWLLLGIWVIGIVLLSVPDFGRQVARFSAAKMSGVNTDE